MHILIYGGGQQKSIGGVNKSNADLANYLVAKNHKVTIVGHGVEGDVPYYTPHESVETCLVKPPTHSPKSWLPLQIVVIEKQPDIMICVTTNKLSFYAMNAIRDLGVPIIRSERGNPGFLVPSEKVWNGRSRLRQLSFEGATGVHLLMDSFKFDFPLPEHLQDRIKIIPEAVFPAKEFARPLEAIDGRFKIIYAGRLTEFEKNFSDLIKAFLSITEKHSQWDLHVFGGIRAEIDEYSKIVPAPLKSRVIFHGSISQGKLIKEYASANLFVLPSASEGCPLALREAMAHGLPVIGYGNCGGVRDIINSGENGLLVGDYVVRSDGLAECMDYLIERPELREVLSANGIKSTEQYLPATIFSAWEAFIVGVYNAELAIELDAPTKNEVERLVGKNWNELMNLVPEEAPRLPVPRLSLVITVFNKEPYLRECLEAVAAQTVVDSIEVLIVDDNSSDGSRKIIEEFSRRFDNFRGLFNDKNQGLSEARNIGLRAARGHWVGFWDGDDVLNPGAYEQLIAYAEIGDADICAGVLERWQKGKKATVGKRQQQFLIEKVGFSIEQWPEFFQNFSSCSKIFRRDFLVENKLYFKRGLFMQDLEHAYVTYNTTSRLVQTPVKIGRYRIGNSDSGSRQISTRRLESLFVIKNSMDRYCQSADVKAAAQIVLLRQAEAFCHLIGGLDNVADRQEPLALLKGFISQFSLGELQPHPEAAILLAVLDEEVLAVVPDDLEASFGDAAAKNVLKALIVFDSGDVHDIKLVNELIAQLLVKKIDVALCYHWDVRFSFDLRFLGRRLTLLAYGENVPKALIYEKIARFGATLNCFIPTGRQSFCDLYSHLNIHSDAPAVVFGAGRLGDYQSKCDDGGYVLGNIDLMLASAFLLCADSAAQASDLMAAGYPNVLSVDNHSLTDAQITLRGGFAQKWPAILQAVLATSNSEEGGLASCRLSNVERRAYACRTLKKNLVVRSELKPRADLVIGDNASLRIVYISNKPFGLVGTLGMYAVISEVAKQHDVLVFCPRGGEDIVYSNPKVSINSRYDMQAPYSDQLPTGFVESLREFDPHIIHCFGTRCIDVVQRVRELALSARIIMDIRSPIIAENINVEIKMKERLMRGQYIADHLSFHCYGTYERDLGSSAVPVSIIPPGYFKDNFKVKRPELVGQPKKFVFVGSVAKVRKIDRLVRQFVDAHEKVSADITLDIFGDGDAYGEVKALIKNLGASRYIRMKGMVRQLKLHKKLATYDAGIAFVPAIERFSTAPSIKSVEYAAAGIPVICTRTKGHEEFSERFGLKFFYYDDVEDGFSSLLSELPEVNELQCAVRSSQKALVHLRYENLIQEYVMPMYAQVIGAK